MLPREWTFEALTVGTTACFEREITEIDIDAFSQLSGDHNPLHANRTYAQQAGFRNRVMHGAMLSALVSRFVGMELPGLRSLLLSINLDYVAPSFPGDTLEVVGTVQSVHAGQHVIALRICIRCGDEVRGRGSALVKVRP